MLEGLVGPLLGAATAIGGKLFDRHQAEKQKDFNPVAKRVRDAQAAGVHPIYALGAHGLDSPPAQVAFGETMGKAGQSIGDAIGKSFNTDDKVMKNLLLEKAGLENDLLRTQITRAQASSTGPTVPNLDQKYFIDGQGQTAIAPAIPGTTVSYPGSHKLEQPQYMPNLTMGWPYRTNPRFSDAQSYEDRYGEAMGSIFGAVNVLADAQHNVTEWSRPKWNAMMERLKR